MEGFASTVWTQIRRAKERDPEAIEALLRRYRPPVLRYLRHRGLAEHDAEDVAQETFLRIVKDDLLRKAEADRGRFRSLLLGITKNVAGDWLKSRDRLKRGGGVAIASLDAPPRGSDATSWEDLLPQNVQESDFDRHWAANLARLGMDRLREECDRSGSRFFETLCAYVNEPQTYGELSRRLGVKEGDVVNRLHHARKKLRAYVEELIYEYSSSPEEYDAERAYLKRFL